MNYGDHNFIGITQQTKLRDAPVALVVSIASIRAVRQARHSKYAWTRHIEHVESWRVQTWLAKWNLGLSIRLTRVCLWSHIYQTDKVAGACVRKLTEGLVGVVTRDYSYAEHTAFHSLNFTPCALMYVRPQNA